MGAVIVEAFLNLFELVNKRVSRFVKRSKMRRNVAMCDRLMNNKVLISYSQVNLIALRSYFASLEC